jgi:hypothetical protein
MPKAKTRYEQIPLTEVLKLLRKAPERLSIEKLKRRPKRNPVLRNSRSSR